MPQHDNQTYQQLKRAILQRRFSHLNPMQRQAVLAVEGPVLILAGAGSGKTTVLIHRIACLLQFGLASVRQDDMPPLSEEDWRILELAAADGSYMERAGQLIAHDVPAPWNILAITFTNKAAGELRARLAGMLGTRGEDVHAATFHAACSRILRAEIEALGYNRNFTIYDTDDSVRVIKDAMAELHISDKNFAPKALLGNISRAKDKMLTPEGLRQSAGDNFALQVTARIYGRYQQMLKDANALDFDDIILLTVKLFQQFPEVLQKYQRRYRYIMVDEYQDTNHAQYLLVSLLAAAHGNLCVVGDDDQSIYKFRGATIENILSFEQQFGQTKVIRLEQNYRSTGTILDAANAVISRNSQRKGKTLWTQNSRGEKVLYHKAADEQREAHFIASTIRKNHEKGAKYSDHAILYRMNALSSTLEQMFIRQGIPYRIIGGLKFFDRKEVKDILAYLAVLNNPDDSLRLRRIINEPKRGIGEATMNTAQQVAELFILIGLGALGAKTGLLRPEGKQTLSNLLVNLVVPAMIINSYRMEFSAEILHNLMAAFALSTLSILLGLIITLLFTARSRDSRTPIFRFACVFSNAGYMGLPLISALFGSEGLLYASAFFTMFNLLLWTVGYSMVSGSSDPKKVAQSLLHCPAIYAIVVGLAIYLLQIPLPDLIVQPMELLGDMNTPLSMLITGMLIASGDLHRTLTDQHIWKLTVVRMLFIPVLTIAAFAALGLFRYGMVTQVIVLLECCPAASITSVFAVQFHHDEQFAAGSVVLTTLLSIVFLPLCALIITMF